MTRTLLTSADPPAVERLTFEGSSSLLLVCDHASRAVPSKLSDLGLPPSALAQHIAWDIGAADLARALAARLRVNALLSGFSRLVIDCNRHLHDPTSMAAESDGHAIPANVSINPEARQARVAELFAPYHAAVAEQLNAIAARPSTPILVAVHSFTPVMRGFHRPWHCGVLWDRDARLAKPLIDALRSRGDIEVGDNEPYSGREPAGYTVDVHAAANGWPHVAIEIRQDLIADPAGVSWWADALVRALAPWSAFSRNANGSAIAEISANR